MAEIPKKHDNKNVYSSSQFKKMMETGQICKGKNGRLKFGDLLPEYKRLLDKDNEQCQNKDNAIEVQKNAKIKNATKCEYNGVKFDSILEKDFYLYCTNNNIRFKHQVTYELQEEFVCAGAKIRKITWTPDFDFGTFIIDTKGFAPQQVILKIKMFMYKYSKPVYIFKTKKDFYKIHELINKHK